jgi:hypothetical protein
LNDCVLDALLAFVVVRFFVARRVIQIIPALCEPNLKPLLQACQPSAVLLNLVISHQ